MYNLGMVMIGGSGASARGSLFSSGFSDNFGAGLSGPSLGQAEQQAYADAKAAVALFDQLVARTQRIANQTAREKIISDYGLNDPTNQDKGLYTRNGVAANISQAESYTPVNYLLFGQRQVTNRLKRLQDFNHDFKNDVQDAETTYGILPEPVVITKIVTTPGASVATTNWTIPLVVAAGGIGVAAMLGLFSGK